MNRGQRRTFRPGVRQGPQPEPLVRRSEALDALEAAGIDAVPVLLNYSNPRGESVSMLLQNAGSYLSDLGLRKPMQRLAFEALEGTNAVARLNALVMLPCPVLEGESATLLKLVREGPQDLRQAALNRLNRCQVTDNRLLPLYKERLQNAGPSEQNVILRSLKAFGASAGELAPTIRQLVKKGVGSIPIRAAETAWAIDADTNILVDVIGILERRQEFPELIETLQFLGEMGPVAKPAVPAILQAVERGDPQLNVRFPLFLIERAAEALRKIDPGSEEKLPNPIPGGLMPRGIQPPPGHPPAAPTMPFG